MVTHNDLKKFAVKYNNEFKIAGIHKLKKADLINAIEQKLSKSRKEIKQEYKQLKEMKKPSISDVDIKSNFLLGDSYFKLLGASLGGKLDDNELQENLKQSKESAKLFRRKKLTQEQKDMITKGLKNIKEIIKNNKENKKTKKEPVKKEPAPKPKQKKTTVKKEPVKKEPVKKTTVKKEPVKKTTVKPTPKKKISTKEDEVRPIEKVVIKKKETKPKKEDEVRPIEKVVIKKKETKVTPKKKISTKEDEDIKKIDYLQDQVTKFEKRNINNNEIQILFDQVLDCSSQSNAKLNRKFIYEKKNKDPNKLAIIILAVFYCYKQTTIDNYIDQINELNINYKDKVLTRVEKIIEKSCKKIDEDVIYLNRFKRNLKSLKKPSSMNSMYGSKYSSVESDIDLLFFDVGKIQDFCDKVMKNYEKLVYTLN